MLAWSFIILFWTDECDWQQQGRRRIPTTTRRRSILPWHCLFWLCHYQCCIFIPHQWQQWLRGDDFFFGFFISTILCLSLYLIPHVASKHLTIGFIIITKFQISLGWCEPIRCWLFDCHLAINVYPLFGKHFLEASWKNSISQQGLLFVAEFNRFQFLHKVLEVVWTD